MTSRRPYTGPIWRERPTVADVVLFPVALLYMGMTLAAVGVAAFLLNPAGVLGLDRKDKR